MQRRSWWYMWPVNSLIHQLKMEDFKRESESRRRGKLVDFSSFNSPIIHIQATFWWDNGRATKALALGG